MSLERRRKKYGRHESELLQCLMGYMSQAAAASTPGPSLHGGPCPECEANHLPPPPPPLGSPGAPDLLRPRGSERQPQPNSYQSVMDRGVPNSIGHHSPQTSVVQAHNFQQVSYQSQEALNAYQNYVQRASSSSSSSSRKKDLRGNRAAHPASEKKGGKGQAPRDRWPSPPPPILLPPLPRGSAAATAPRPLRASVPAAAVGDVVWTPRTPGVMEPRAPSPLTVAPAAPPPAAAPVPQRRSRIDYHEAPMYHDTDMYKSKSLGTFRGATSFDSATIHGRQNRVTFETPTRSQTMPRLRLEDQEPMYPAPQDATPESQWEQRRGQLRYRSKSHSPQRSRHFRSLESQDSTDSIYSQGARPKSYAGSPQTPKVYLPRVPSAHSNPLPTSSATTSPYSSRSRFDTCACRGQRPGTPGGGGSRPPCPLQTQCGMCVAQDVSCKVCEVGHAAVAGNTCSDEQILAAAAALTAMSTGASSSYLPRDPEVYLGERHQRAMVRLCALLWVANQVPYISGQVCRGLAKHGRIVLMFVLLAMLFWSLCPTPISAQEVYPVPKMVFSHRRN